MSNRVDIANLALTWMGANQITSLEDEAPEAQILKVNYDLARDATLEAHEWSFAIERWIPAKDPEGPVWGAGFRFKIPSNIIRVLRVENTFTGPLPSGTVGNVNQQRQIGRRMEADWKLESGYIITDESAILCKGIRRIEDEGIFSNLFVHAFAAKLAMLTAYSITESDGKFNAMSALYKLHIQEAKTRDGLQGSPSRLRNRSLQNAR